MLKTQIKRFDFDVTTEGQASSNDFELDGNVKAVFGILMTADRDDLMFYRGSQKVEIDGCEIVPEKYESKLLMCGLNVEPSKRFYDLERVEVKSGKVKLIYTDTNHSYTTFEAYRVSVYLKCEIEDK